MKYIMLKTFRDIRETAGSFISILVIIFIGCFFFAGIGEGAAAITAQVEDYYAMQNLADARGEYMYVNSAAVADISAADGVTEAAGYDTFQTRTTSFGGIRYDMTITTLTPGIDDPKLTEGRLPETGKREMIIDSVFADKHGVKIGDRVEFGISALNKIKLSFNPTLQYAPEYESVEHEFTVCGFYHSPDVIYKVNLRNTSAAPASFVFAQVNYGEIRSYTDDASIALSVQTPGGETETPLLEYSALDVELYNGVKVKCEKGFEGFSELFDRYTVSTQEQLEAIFADPNAAAGLYMYSLEREQFPSVSAFSSMNDTIAALAAVLPLIFFAVAAAITVISLSKTVDNQRMQIGVIQALGVSKGNVYFSYIFYALFACLIGGFAGGLVGTFFVPYLLDVIYARQFSMPPTAWRVTGVWMLIGVAISAALACLSAFVSCYKTLRVVPAQAMRPKPPKKTRRILAERWTGLWKKLGFGAKMNLRNMFLHKTKMVLSSVGIVGCLALLIGLIGLKDNMSMSFRAYDASANYDISIVTDVAVDITDKAIYDEMTGADGEEYMHTLTFVPDFSGRFEFGGKTADLTVMAIPTYADEKNYPYADADCVRLYTDVGGKHRVLFESDTFVIPEMLAQKLGAKAGDTVRVTGYSLDNRSIDFEAVITAVVCEYFEQKAYCAYDVFAKNNVGLLADKTYGSFLPGADETAAIAALESHEAVRAVQTFRENFEALEKQMSLLDYAVIIFVVGAAALAIAVIYNITATNLKERTREIATLMVLGYNKHETANMLIVENLVITGLGCVLGLPLGYGLLWWLVEITKLFNVFISSFFSWYVVLGCIALTFAFSLIATMLLNTKLKKISMVEALKSVE